MRVLEQLEPQGVFRFFEELCAIPHGSRNCQAVSDWCAAFARERGLECHQDQAGNVIIIQEATPGYEAAAPVILQGHLDMVCEKEPGCTKDMAGEGLDLLVEDGCVRAKGTTLGGDDGIAVAMALAILDDQAIPHPRLEVVLTTDEEIGMLGAEALDAAPLRGRKLINVDSEEEGIFTVSCAGGSMAQCTLPVTRAPYDGAVLEVTVRGLTGGHSGTEIHKGRANACVLLGRLLQAMAERTELRLVTAAGGGKDNAIAVEASAQVVVSDDAVARQAAEALAADLSREYTAADPGLRVEAAPCTVRETPMDWASTERAVCMLTCLPNGVQAMSMEIHGLVQTSLNLGILGCGADGPDGHLLRPQLPGQPEGDAPPSPPDPDGAAGGHCLHLRGLSRLGVPAGLLPAGPDDGGLSGAVRPEAKDRGHPRGRGVRYSERQAAGAGLCVHWPESAGHPHPAGADGDRLRPAGVAVRAGSAEAVQMRRRGAAEAAPLHIVAGNPLYAAPFRGTIAAKPPETGAIREGTSCIIVSASAGGRICTRRSRPM